MLIPRLTKHVREKNEDSAEKFDASFNARPSKTGFILVGNGD